MAELESRNKRASLMLDSDREEHFGKFLGESAGMQAVKHLAYKASRTRFNVILLGESGTGKSRLAREIHNIQNPNAPFVEVACNSIARLSLSQSSSATLRDLLRAPIKTAV